MCGIAGSVLHGIGHDEWVDRALDAIAHRGPDGRGITYVDDVTHGHVRLAIMDPTPRSDQPFEYRDVVLSYVGELWNYRDLRADLERRGYEFSTTGDTEVVAAMLQAAGPDALDAMHGQYALAWTDRRSGRTTLARDRYGEVPLYVLEEPGSLFEPGAIRWASERKAFDARGAEAEAVPAGSTWALGRRPVSYYDPDVELRRNGHRVEPERVQELLRQAVARRLQSDVPVCCLLSGGIDSTSILRLAMDHQPGIVAYTAVFDEKGVDTVQARKVAAELGVELREVRIEVPTADDLRESIRCIEIGMKAQIEIAVHCLPLARQIYADGYRVVLSGEGSDEIFGGYHLMQRRAWAGEDWTGLRLNAVKKMARGNFVRINKAFMHAGVEARTPFMDRPLVETVIPLDRECCYERKSLLRDAMRGAIPEIARRQPKLAFQIGTGMRDHLARELSDRQLIRYNAILRELFGGLPTG